MKLAQINVDSFKNNQYNTIDDEIKHLFNKIKAIKKDLEYYTNLKTDLHNKLRVEWQNTPFPSSWKGSIQYAIYIGSKPYKKCGELTNWEAMLTTRLNRLKMQKRMGTNAVKYPYTL